MKTELWIIFLVLLVVLPFEKYVHLSTCSFQEPINLCKKPAFFQTQIFILLRVKPDKDKDFFPWTRMFLF